MAAGTGGCLLDVVLQVSVKGAERDVRFEPEADRIGSGRSYRFRFDFAFIALRTSFPKARSFSRRSARLAELKASSA